jgi:putative ABC transport system substrate-binding protein
MRRRAFLLFLGTAWSGGLAARTEPLRNPPPGGKHRVVVRCSWGAKFEQSYNPTFNQALSRALASLGFVEGANLELVYQLLSDETRETQVRLLAELASKRVDAVVVGGEEDARRVLAVGDSIPIVAWDIPDPVAQGFARSLARPGGRVTGLTYGYREMVAKQVHFLQRLVPHLSAVAFPGGAGTHNSMIVEAALSAARLGSKRFDRVSHLVEAAPALRQQGVQAVMIRTRDATLVAKAAIRGRLASIGFFDTDAEAGLLASYGEHYFDLVHRIAQVTASLLRGASPAETPFVEPMRFKLALNRSTARALDLKIPPDVLLAADELYD